MDWVSHYECWLQCKFDHNKFNMHAEKSINKKKSMNLVGMHACMHILTKHAKSKRLLEGKNPSKLGEFLVWQIYIPYLLDQMLRLLFFSSRNFVRLLFESGYYLRAAFIKLSAISKSFHNVRALRKASFIRSTKNYDAVTWFWSKPSSFLISRHKRHYHACHCNG